MASQKHKGSEMSGRLGNILTYPLNGKMVSRTIGVSTKPPTENQLAILSIGPLINDFTKHVKEFISVGFELEGKLNNQHFTNEMYAYTFNNALKGKYPSIEIDYTKVLFSKGLMPKTLEVVAQPSVNGLTFTWDPKVNNYWRWNDRVMIMAYIPEIRKAQYIISGATRNNGVEFLPLQEFLEPLLIHTYVSFIAADHRSISDSLYTGAILWKGDNM